MTQEALQIRAKRQGSSDPGDLVFLCHNNADKAFIRRLADVLELEFGTSFFLDVFAIPTGEAFIPWIEKAMERCTVCAIFLGGNGWGPTHLWEAELAMARYRRDPSFRIIPVALPDLSLIESAKLGSGRLFQEINWADFTKGADDKDSLEKLEAALTGRKTLGYRGPARLTPYQVRRDAERWQRSGRSDSSILYSGAQLAEAEAMVRENPDAMDVAGVSEFLSSSREGQSVYWRRLAMAAVGTAAVLLAAATIAISNYLVAEQRRQASVSRQLAMIARDAAGADRALSIGARALLVADTPEARGALIEQLQEFRFLKRIVNSGSYIESVALSSSGDYVLATDEGLRVLSPGKNSADAVEAVSRETVTSVATSEEGTWLGREDGRVDRLRSGVVNPVLKADPKVPTVRERRVRVLAYDPSKRLVAVGTGAGRLAILDARYGTLLHEIDEGDGIRIEAISFDPTRRRLAFGTSAGIVLTVDTDTLSVVDRYPHVEGGILALGYLKDGSLIVLSRYGHLLYFNASDGSLVKPSGGDTVPLATAAAIEPSTGKIAIGDSAGVIRLFEAVTQHATDDAPLRGHSDSVTAISFGKSGKQLLSASSNGTAALWDLVGREGPYEEMPQLNPAPSAIRVNSNGAVIAISLDQSQAQLRRLEGSAWTTLLDLVSESEIAGRSGKVFKRAETDATGFEEIISSIPSVALDDNGSRIAWTTSGGAILTTSVASANAATTVLRPGGGTAPDELGISGDGRTVAAIREDGTVVSIYRVGTPEDAEAEIRPPAAARSIALDRDGQRIAIGMKDGMLSQYSRTNEVWTTVGRPHHAHTSEVAGIAYSQDGNTIVSFGSGGGGADRTVVLTGAGNPADQRVLQARQAAGSVSAMSLGADLLAVGDHDGRVLTWSRRDSRFAGILSAGSSEVSALYVDEKRRRVITSSGDGSVKSWTLDLARWIGLACSKANRDLGRDEWHELMPDDRFVPRCSQRRPYR
ncbi:toll/interleukin-1 receptor domain-containing protein [Bradyrhizobium sp. Bra78]|uniref:toll/interleukin-1 receptor domain-containing protein n=1 Tax=Bradyrhizobium sp. Bra78 TaxID=2926010 RepID=UPI0021C692B8|nr:TIR domain-containing protein [Bradyrhizobium sp. Bra78]